MIPKFDFDIDEVKASKPQSTIKITPKPLETQTPVPIQNPLKEG
jgi:hypothetical protein